MHDPAMAIPSPKLKEPNTKTQLTGAIWAFGGRRGAIGSIRKAPNIKW